LIALANMLGALSLALVAILRRPGQFRLISAVHQLDQMAWQAVPIILLITLRVARAAPTPLNSGR